MGNAATATAVAERRDIDAEVRALLSAEGGADLTSREVGRQLNIAMSTACTVVKRVRQAIADETPVVIVPLTSDERLQFDSDMREIEEGMSTWIRVSLAIRRIHDNRSYRETHGTWEAFARDRLGWDRRTAHRHLQSLELAESIGMDAIGDASERAVRELASVPEADRKAVWESSKALTNGHTPSAAAVATAAAESKAPPDDLDVNEHLDDETPTPSRALSPIGPQRPAQVSRDEKIRKTEQARQDAQDRQDEEDAEFLTTLNQVRDALSPRCREIYDVDALKYRRIFDSDQFQVFVNLARRVLKDRKIAAHVIGPLHMRAKAFLNLKHPRDWAACVKCDGKGGVCCADRGYSIN